LFNDTATTKIYTLSHTTLFRSLKGKNCMILDAISALPFQAKTPKRIPSMICQRIKNPSAKAERLTSIPRNKQKEKKPKSLTKNATKNSKSEKMILSSL